MRIRTIALLCLSTLLTTTGLLAAGGSETPPNRDSEVVKTPEEQAADHYNRGLTYRDKAWKLEAKLANATDAKQREKTEKKIARSYESAVEEFVSAVNLNPQMFQAFSSLGYALRKTGKYGEALVAYDRALALNPDYTEAVEYRAEAYLGLNRFEEAKQAYMQLFQADRAKADELLEAMQKWVESRRGDPAGLDAGQIDAFAAWVDERAELSAVTAPVSELRERSW